jgi:YidC/Oxa1 family membrane protein insertase
MGISGVEEFMTEIAKSNSVTFKEMTTDTLIDVLYKFKPDNWTALAEKFPDISKLVTDTQTQVDKMNYFLGLNIADAPFQIMMRAIKTGTILLIIGAVLIPVLAALTQWMNAKLMSAANPQSQTDANDSMASTMKTMNTVMPLMSAVFCLQLPTGMGIYWIAGAVVRSVQQLVINKKIDKIDIDELIKKNLEKSNKKREKQGLPPQKLSNTAKMNTRNIDRPETSTEEKEEKVKKSTDFYNSTTTAKPGSLASKAQMVKQYNERNTKK